LSALRRRRSAFLGGRYDQVIGLSDTPQNLYWKNRSYSELARGALARLGQLPPAPQVHELVAEAFPEQDGTPRQRRNFKTG
jgi:hypothetical protein